MKLLLTEQEIVANVIHESFNEKLIILHQNKNFLDCNVSNDNMKYFWIGRFKRIVIDYVIFQKKKKNLTAK